MRGPIYFHYTIAVLLWLISSQLSLGAQQARQAIPSRMTTVRSIGLAMPGILFQYNGSPGNSLSSLNTSGKNPYTLDDARKSLEDWGVYNRNDLLSQLNQLIDSGSNEQYQYLAQIYNEYRSAFRAAPRDYQANISHLYSIDNESLRRTMAEIWGIYHDLSYTDIRRLVFIAKMSEWFQIQPISIQGWDQARIVALVRWAYDVGYLSEEEAWPFIEQAGNWVMQNFSSWTRFAENYIYGRLFEYAGLQEASVLFRDSSLIWWELIDQGGAWNGIRLQSYQSPEDSLYLTLYKNLYYFQSAIRKKNSEGVQNILDQDGVVVSPELAQRQSMITVNGVQLLQQPLDQPDYRGIYPVILATIYDDRSLSILINRGFRYQVYDRDGRSALHWAARDGSVNTVNLILQLGLNPNQPDNNGVTPIHLAARYNNSLVLYALLNDKRSAELFPDSQGYTPLHEACYNTKDPNTFGVLLQERYTKLSIDPKAGPMGVTPLMIAAENASSEQIVSLLQRGANPNARDNQGWTALHYAAKSGSRSALRLLISDGADINARSNIDETPLKLAIRYTDSRTVAVLLQAGADINTPDRQLKKPIHWAALNPDINVLELLLDNGVDPNEPGPNQQSPLHFAAELGSVPHLQLLLDRGANINAVSRFGFSPLMIAVSNRRYEAVNFLINAGADINLAVTPGSGPQAQSGRQNTSPLPQVPVSPSNALSGTSFSDSNQISRQTPPNTEQLNNVQPSTSISQVTQNDAAADYYGWSPVTLAASQGDYQMIWSLVEAGAEFQNTNIRGWYPLHLAAAKGSTETLAYLISRGANIQQGTGDGLSALELAATDLQNGAEKVRLLLREGLSPMFTDNRGWSAMTYAALSGNREVVRLLLNFQVNPNDPNVSLPPLVAAAYSGHQDIIFLLLQRGADPNIRFLNQGTSALHYAVALNRPELWAKESARKIPELLLQSGALVNLADKSGNTPLFWAARWGNGRMVKLLLDWKANPYTQNSEGLSPFYYALENSYGASRYLLDSFPLAQINRPDPHSGLTPLLRAASVGQHRSVALVLAAGAQLMQPDASGYNALFYALFADDAENIGTLMRAGMNASQPVEGMSPLLYGITQGAATHNIEILLNWLRPADIEASDPSGNHAINHAVAAGNLELARLLLRYGANVNALDQNRDPPLVVATKLQNFDMAQLLLEAGADTQKPSADFQSPYQIASSLSNSRIAQLLLSYGANPRYGLRPDTSSNPDLYRPPASLDLQAPADSQQQGQATPPQGNAQQNSQEGAAQGNQNGQPQSSPQASTPPQN